VPNPKKGENLSQFVGRYMGSSEAEKTFPKKKQRLAVAYSKFARRKKKK
jgi:hypothetical protein